MPKISALNHWFILSILLLFAAGLSPLLGREQGKPFIHNYMPKHYRAHTQNWSILQDHKGVMYFGNTSGVLQYDGANWELIKLPNFSVARSLALDTDGKIYVGGVSELGFLAPDSIGKMRYTSLLDYLPEDLRSFGDVWSVHVQGGVVYFQTTKYLFTYSLGVMEVLPLTGSYHRSFLIDGDLYVRQDGLGLGTLKWGNWEACVGGELFSNKIISAMLPWRSGQILIGTRKNGLYILSDASGSGQSISPFSSPASDWLKEHPLYHATRMANNTYVFASLGGGVLITDDTGNILRKLNIESGLNNNRGHFVFPDKDNALWVAMDNGIAHAEINSPLTRWDRESGLFGSIYSVIRHKQQLYAGGSDGIFRLEESVKGDFRFYQLTDERTQVWQFVVNPMGGLLACSSNGMLELSQNGSWQRVALEGKQCFAALFLPSNPNKILVGHSQGVFLLEKMGGQWNVIQELNSVGMQIRNFMLKDQGEVWANSRYQGVLQMHLGTDGRVEKVRELGKKEGLPSVHNVHLSNIDGDILAGTSKGLYVWSKNKQRFLPDGRLGAKFTNGEYGVRYLARDRDGDLWIHATEDSDRREWIEVGLKQAEGGYQIDSVTLKRLTEAEVYSIYPDWGKVTWVGCSDGLFRYDNRIHDVPSNAFHAIVREVIIPEDSVVFYGNYPLSYTIIGENRYLQQSPPTLELPYFEHSVTFRFSTPSFENEASNRFSYYLAGHDESWSEWTHNRQHSYFELPAGDYTFYVKARNLYDQESTIATFKLRILPAWYHNPLIIALGGGLMLALLILGGKIYSHKVERDNRRLEALIWKRTSEVREQKREIEEINQELGNQKEEIASQRDLLASSVENMRKLSLIGLELASALSISKLVEVTYYHLDELIDFSAFGLGFYNEETERIEFPEAISDEKRLPNFEYGIKDRQYLAVHSFLEKKEIVIDNYDLECYQYADMAGQPLKGGENMKSLIYMPLLVKDKPVGVLTIQHHHPGRFSDYQVGLLRNLAVYLAIAVEHAEAYHLVEQQKHQIEASSKAVYDSISYAERIQHAILPKISEIQHHLPDSFVFLRPRNVVSGDFHWFAAKRDLLGNLQLVIAAVDCTGHGVPGAFMSMVAHELLREIVMVQGVIEADRILNRLHVMVRKELKQEETGNNDGMDISLCVLNFAKAKLEFAGAKNSLVYIRGGELHELKGDNQSIGGTQREEERVFSKQVIQLDPEEETAFYLFSDGFQDQFGGEKRRKFTSRRFRGLLKAMHKEGSAKQEELLQQALLAWMGRESQVDDILVIGFRA